MENKNVGLTVGVHKHTIALPPPPNKKDAPLPTFGSVSAAVNW